MIKENEVLCPICSHRGNYSYPCQTNCALYDHRAEQCAILSACFAIKNKEEKGNNRT